MKKALSIVFGLGGIVCLLGLWFLGASPRARMESAHGSRSPAATAVSGLGYSTSNDAPGVVHEDKGRLELVKRVAIAEVRLDREIIEQPVRINFGDAPTVKFVLHDKSLAHPSASVLHGNDAARQVPVLDAGDGNYEVPFTPTGPGLFNVVLNDSGTPVASKRIGVVGVAGAPGESTDQDFLSVDPRSPSRWRTGGRASRR
jgi:hypothetical protein